MKMNLFGNEYTGDLEKLMRDPGVRITRIQDNWVKGTIDGRHFEMKVFAEWSDYGIGQGRISKLVICSTPSWDHTKVVLSYDRGWETEPTKETLPILQKLRNLLGEYE